MRESNFCRLGFYRHQDLESCVNHCLFFLLFFLLSHFFVTVVFVFSSRRWGAVIGGDGSGHGPKAFCERGRTGLLCCVFKAQGIRRVAFHPRLAFSRLHLSYLVLATGLG